MGIRLLGLVLWALFSSVAARAQSSILLHELFRDHAVLQRGQPIAVWGQAASGELVTISLSASTVRAQADASGRWSAVLPPLQAGGPFVLSAQGSSGAKAAANDVLVGDVFLCSGQSNMELPVLRVGDSRNEIEISANNTIRMLTIGHATSPVPRVDLPQPALWQIASPSTVPEWSAACFFFAREIQKTVQVPIGLLHSSWGGSNIRPWMSASALRAIAGHESGLDTLTLYAKNPDAAQARFAQQWEQWWHRKTGERPGAQPWSAASRSSTPGEWRDAPAGLGDWRDWGVAELKDFTGLVWYRTRVSLSAAQAKSAATLELGAINQIDETWLNGRALGNTFGYGTERTYPVAVGRLHAGENVLIVNVLSTYGGGGLLGSHAKRSLRLAGGEMIPLDGAWQYSIVPSAMGYPPQAPWESVSGLTTLYNAMIAPLGSYGLRGVLWYQGESNAGEAEAYGPLLTGLLADWRRQFGSDLPFLIVQLPNYGRPPLTPAESGWAEIRETQRQVVAHDPHAGLAVTIDIGDARNLHPTNKQDVGRRLALAARHVIYGESIPASGPIPLSAKRAAGEVAVEFGDIERGLVSYSHDSPIGFELCADAPGTCRFAEARIEGSRVTLAIPDGLAPTRVRYGWADSPVCTLFDLSGLPVGPFEVRISP